MMVSTKGQLTGGTCYCSGCGRYFTGASSFDSHFQSTGHGVEHPKHMNPLKLKRPMEVSRRTADGSPVWGFPLSPEQREKMQKVWDAKKKKEVD